MKLVSTLVLLMALFSSVAFADGNQGSGGRGYNGDVKTTVKTGGIRTEDGDPPPPPCVPSSTNTCFDDGNQGSGGRATSVSIIIFVEKYLIGLFA